MEVEITSFAKEDIIDMAEVWNEVVEDADAFPQEEPLSEAEALEFFSRQDFTGVAKADGAVAGLYILHPNNEGRCGHMANASYAVKNSARGQNIGEKLVLHSLNKARELGYRLLVFNAVVKGNDRALKLYGKLGFVKVGEIPGGFRTGAGEYRDINVMYHIL